MYNTFPFQENVDSKKYSKVIEKFQEFFVDAKSETYERYVFFSREMKAGETADEYITCLKKFSSTCNFSTLSDSLIRDRVLQTITDMTVKERLLRTKNLNLTKTLGICKSAEITKTQYEST